MGTRVRRLLAIGWVSVLPAVAIAQQPTTVNGRVTNESGTPLASASVFVEGMGIGTVTREDGRYSFIVPAARATGQVVGVTARVIAYKPKTARVTLTPGQIVRQDFALSSNPLQLGEVVVTGAGTVTTAEKLGNVRNNVPADQLVKSAEANVVEALAGKAPNVEVTGTSGEPGSSSYIRIRGIRTLTGNGQPLFVIDGVPVDNSSTSTSDFNPTDEVGAKNSGTTQTNRASDINPDDIESIEILKGAAAGAIYGARAGQGVILITTKHGKPGPTQYSLRSTMSINDINHTYPLQTKYGQGRNGVTAGSCDDTSSGACRRSWGPLLTGTTYDHANEAYTTGQTLDNTLTVSGGNDRTTFFLSGSYLNDKGIFVGPNNYYNRSTVRLNGAHFVTSALKVGGNFSYADTRGAFIQRGNNVNGLQLGLLRTPPDFNNLPYLDPVNHLHRSYRLQHPGPGDLLADRGFDNPFYVLNEDANTARTSRAFGNVNVDYAPLSWLKANYTLGADYSNDQRLEGTGVSSSDVGNQGRVTEGQLSNYQLDHNLTATASFDLNRNFSGTFTLGQNLNSRRSTMFGVVGRTLIAPQPFRLSNTVNRDTPIDNLQVIHNESYFGQATMDVHDQLYLTFAARNDGSSTFSESHRHSWFPKASAAWNFTKATGVFDRFLTYGKARVAYGQTGQEPSPYLTSPVFATGILGGIAQGTGLGTTQGGFGGLITSGTKPSLDLKPERTTEFETGFDLGFFDDRADLSYTYYKARTNDVILPTPLPPSTGFTTQYLNSGKLENRGHEVALNIRPINRRNFGWDVGFQWAQNRSRAIDLGGAQYVFLDASFSTIIGEVFKPGEELGVIYDFGFVRCGITPAGTLASADAACAGKAKGTMFIDSDGFPVLDPGRRVVGNPNPRWTGSTRSGIRVGKFNFSGLLDIRHGGEVYNGTRGALYSYGTHKDTEQRATCTSSDPASCSGNEKKFGSAGWFPGPVTGIGAGKSVPIGQNWYRDGLGACPFVGIAEPCIEDGGYVKLRELSMTYNWSSAWVSRVLGLSSVDIRIAGRNLKTWTNYTGYDPETNSGGAIEQTRGSDYFNMPQTRSFVFSLGLNR